MCAHFNCSLKYKMYFLMQIVETVEREVGDRKIRRKCSPY